MEDSESSPVAGVETGGSLESVNKTDIPVETMESCTESVRVEGIPPAEQVQQLQEAAAEEQPLEQQQHMTDSGSTSQEDTCSQGPETPAAEEMVATSVPAELEGLITPPPEDITVTPPSEGHVTPPVDVLTASSASDLQSSVNGQSLNGFEFIGDSDVAAADAMAAEAKVEDGHGDAENVAKNEANIMDVLGNGRLVKKVLKEGGGFQSRPKAGDIATIKYTSRVEEGPVVEEQEELSFFVGEGDVVPALDMCVALMEMGEHAEVTTVSDFAYGELGSSSSPSVPPNATLVYDIQLLRSQAAPDFTTMSFQEKHDVIERKRLRGNVLFQRKEFSSAINSYSRAVAIADTEAAAPTEEQAKVLKDTLIKCQNNLAACQLKIEAYKAVLSSCDAVLNLDPENVKGYFRKGKAFTLLGDYVSALNCLRKAAQIEPKNKDIQRELKIVSEKHKKSESSEREMYQKMLGSTPGTPKKNDKKIGGLPYWGLLSGSAIATGVAAMSYAVFKMATENS